MAKQFLPHNGQSHLMGKSLCLAGVIVSGDILRVRVFQRKLYKQSALHGVQGQKSSTVQHGGPGVFGVLQGKRDPVQASEVTVLSYLSSLLEQGKSYSVINTHKSMIIQTLKLLGNVWCDCPSYITRFMKGLFNKMPPVP